MFATLLGAYPRTLLDGTSLDEFERRAPVGGDARDLAIELADELVREVIAEQEAAGIDLVSDGHVRHADLEADVIAAIDQGRSPGLAAAWRFAADHSTRTVKQALPGPYSLGWRRGGPDRAEWTLRAAGALRAEIEQLAAAGCAFVEVEEPRAVRIGPDAGERAVFAAAHGRLVEGIAGPHLSLAFPEGEVEPAGAETLLAPGYASFAFDLLGGPDGWRIIARAAQDRGIVCGVMPADAAAGGDLALMVWAAHYAASTAGRGLARVGIATAGGLHHLTRAEAAAKLARLGEAARLAVGERIGDLAGALAADAIDDGGSGGAGDTGAGDTGDGGRSAGDGGPSARTRILRGLPGAPVPGRGPRPRGARRGT